MAFPTDDLRTRYEAVGQTGHADGDPLATIADQSGNGHNLSQGTASRRPTFRASVINGLPAFRFDGVDDYVSIMAAYSLNDFYDPGQGPQSLCVVLAASSAAGSRTWPYGHSNSTSQIFAIDKGGVAGEWRGWVRPAGNPGTAFLSTSGKDVTAWTVLTLVHDLTTAYLYVDGDLVASEARTGSWTTQNIGMGALPALTSEAFGGDIALAGSWSSALDATARAALHSYVQDTYGIAVSDYVGAPGGPVPDGPLMRTAAGYMRTGSGVVRPASPFVVPSGNLTVNNTGGDAKTDFQVLVELDGTNFDFASTDGSDVRFTDTDDTPLDHWTEAWDTTAQTARCWVKVPSIPANDTTTIKMAYGDESPPKSSAKNTALHGWGLDISERAGAQVMHATIPTATHNAYGCRYPITYIFAVPPGSSGLVASTRTSELDAWEPLDVKQPSDVFNGVEAVRFDYPAGRAYVSASFAIDSDDLWVKIETAGGNLVGAPLGIARYYDNRDATVVSTWDDWTGDPGYHADQLAAADAHISRGLWYSPGLNPGGHHSLGHDPMGSTEWNALQQRIDTGLVEPTNHSNTHVNGANHVDQAQADAEVGLADDAIRANVTMPWQSQTPIGQKVHGYIRPHHGDSTFLQNALAGREYLADRMSPVEAPTNFYPWVDARGYYQSVRASVSADGAALATLNDAFDATLVAGRIHMIYGHPWAHDWSDPSLPILDHLDHIAGRANCWYVGLGHLYQYRFTAWRVALDVWTESHTGRSEVARDTDAGAVDITAPNLNDVGSLFSAEPADLDGAEVSVRLRNLNLKEFGPLLSPTLHVNSPAGGDDYYRVLMRQADNDLLIQRRTSGGSALTRYSGALAANEQTIRIRLHDGTLTVHEGDVQRLSEAWGLPTTAVRLYLRGRGATGATGTDHVDWVFARKFDGVDPTVTVDPT